MITLHHQTKQILTSTYLIMKRITCFFFALALMIGGGAVALFAIVLGGISGNHMTSAVEIYNKSLGYDTSLQIKILSERATTMILKIRLTAQQ